MNNDKDQANLRELESLLGYELFFEVVERFAGKQLYFPKRLVMEKKHEAIRREYAGGADFRDLADKYRYTETHIRRIVRGQEKEEPAYEGFFSRLVRAVAKRLKKIGHSADNGV
jgi:Mor family transcriptional regulator